MFNIINYFFSLRYSKSSLYRDLNNLRQETIDVQNQLVPLENGELNTLSFNVIVPKKFSKNKATIVTTVYNENVIAFFSQMKKDINKGIMLAYSASDEFAYVKYNDYYEVFINENPLGRLHENGHLTDRNNKPIARIARLANSTQKSISILGKEVANLKSPERRSLTEKTFSSIGNLNTSEEQIVLALSLPDVILNS